ncbi:MAG TPA: POTRA domain-containing protein [Terriglobales bacterium]|nr:POTRA domain-containing protein [Terriglobales bacterium]
MDRIEHKHRASDAFRTVILMRWIWILLFFCCLAQAAAQSVAAPATSYEGQPVSGVDLVGDPRLNLEQLRSLVEQKAGEPYSDTKVKASATALQGTGKFHNVEVNVSPQPTGLLVKFVLHPAYYVGVIQFPEATKLFPYTRLLQVVNMPDEQAFDKEQLPQSETALLNFFHDNGYFQAQVRSDVELDEKNQLANVTFHVDFGKRAKIGRVEIQGTTPEEAAKLLHAMRAWRAKLTFSTLKPGKDYTPERIKSGIGLLRKCLAGQHYLANQLQIDPPQYHAATNRADITFRVSVGPKVSVKVAGAKLSVIPYVASRREKKLIPIYSEGAIDRELVEEGRENLSTYFQSKGYFDVRVTTAFQRTPTLISVVYEVDKGHRHKVEELNFTGNHHIGAEELARNVQIKKHRLFSHGQFSDKLLKNSVKNIQTLYRDRGFEEVKVVPQVEDHEPEIDVLFKIEEGPQTLVGEFEIEGNSHLALDQLRPETGFEIRPGGPFSARKLEDDRSHILARYLDLGYLNADVQLQVARAPDDPHLVNVVYRITENQQLRVSKVLLLGQKVTRPSLIHKTANIGPETPLSQGKLLEAESKLYDLGIFDWSSVGPRRPIEDQTDEEALIKVHESKRNTITYGFGFEVSKRGGNLPTGTVAVPGLPAVALDTSSFVSSERTFASPRGSLEFTRKNIRGLGETGAVSLLVARLDQRLLATYADPHFRGLKWRSLFSMSGERTTENPLYAATLADVSFQLERTIDRKQTTTAQFRYNFNHTALSQILVPELVLPQDRNVRLSTFSASIIQDTRDKPLDPHKGHYGTLDFGVTPTALGSSANFTRLVGQYATYRPVTPAKIIWANSIRLGLAAPFAGSFVPTSQRFFAGGGTTLRGFPTNGAGPQRAVAVCPPGQTTGCSRISVPVGGNQLVILNSELRYPIPIINNLGGVVFYDGGDVYSHIRFSDFVEHYTSTVGIGFRYSTPVGPVRIDIGRNLNPIPGINPFQFFITLGQAF